MGGVKKKARGGVHTIKSKKRTFRKCLDFGPWDTSIEKRKHHNRF